MTDRKFCDNEECKKEIEKGNPRGMFYWWPVDDDGNEDYDNAILQDFCSIECVKEWAKSWKLGVLNFVE